MKCGDVLNAYITSPFIGLIWTTLGTKFGNSQGKTEIFVRAFYGLKSSDAAFHKHFGECMFSIGYKPCLSDTDIWFNLEVRDDCVEYYLYILCYANYIPVVHHDARPTLDRIYHIMKLKEGSVGNSYIYFGANFKKVQMSKTFWCWSLSPSKYVQEAVQNCQNHLKENYYGEYELTSNAPNPFLLGYNP